MICAVCALQVFGYRHAAIFLKKKLMNEPTEAKLMRLHQYTGSDTARKTLSRNKSKLIKKLNQTKDKGINIQWLALIPFIAGMCISFIGIFSYFELIPFPYTDVSDAIMLSCAFGGILVTVIGLKFALPGMLLEFAAGEGINLLHKKY